jgi:hypothetical protein
LPTRRKFHVQQFLHGHAVADIVDAGRYIVQTVGIDQRLKPCRVLAALLKRAMQIADLNLGVDYQFTG